MARTFKNFSKELGHKCPICGTDEDKETILVPIFSTINGSVAEATQVHLDCILDNLFCYDNIEGQDKSVIATVANFKCKQNEDNES